MLTAQDWSINTVKLFDSTHRLMQDVLVACWLTSSGLDKAVSPDIKKRYLYTALMRVLRLRPHVNDMADAFGITAETKVPEEAERLGWPLYEIYSLVFQGLSWLKILDDPQKTNSPEEPTWNYVALALRRWANGFLYNCEIPLDNIYMLSIHLEDLSSRQCYQRKLLLRILLVIECEIVKIQTATPDVLMDSGSLEESKRIQTRITSMTTSYDLNVMATALWLYDDVEPQVANKFDSSFKTRNDMHATEDVYKLIKDLYLGIGELQRIQIELLDDEVFQEWWPVKRKCYTGSEKEDDLARAESLVLGRPRPVSTIDVAVSTNAGAKVTD